MKKDSTPGPDGNPYGVYRCAGGLSSKFLYRAYQATDGFAESRTVFIPKTFDTDDLGRIIRSPDALRPLTLCNCDCKLLTSAICRGFHWYTMRCTHSSQRCISSRQMTDNIFEIETTALAHVACAPQESGVLLTDFVAAYPSVNHLWLFCVLENTGLPCFLCRFLRHVYSDIITCVEFAGAERGQFLKARGVRQGCPGVKCGKETEGITTESRKRSVEQLFDTLELVALAVEGSHLSATEDPFEPTARCINNTKKRQLVTKSGVQRRCCVCHLHHEQEMKAPAAVRQFFKTVPQQVCHCQVDVIAADANAAAYKYYQCQECQDLYLPWD